MIFIIYLWMRVLGEAADADALRVAAVTEDAEETLREVPPRLQLHSAKGKLASLLETHQSDWNGSTA